MNAGPADLHERGHQRFDLGQIELRIRLETTGFLGPP
jgi:hypothetical protein